VSTGKWDGQTLTDAEIGVFPGVRNPTLQTHSTEIHLEVLPLQSDPCMHSCKAATPLLEETYGDQQP